MVHALRVGDRVHPTIEDNTCVNGFKWNLDPSAVYVVKSIDTDTGEVEIHREDGAITLPPTNYGYLAPADLRLVEPRPEPEQVVKSDTDTVSTMLGQFRRELIAQGFDEREAYGLVYLMYGSALTGGKSRK